MLEATMMSRVIYFSCIGILAFSLTGCPPKKQIKTDDQTQQDMDQANKPAEEPSLRGKDYKEVSQIAAIYFDLDQATLRADARTTLSSNYAVFKQHADWEAIVEGHCDERGTTEYNLGLGQRRAAAVRQYYMSLGLNGSRVATISYGKENPI